VNVDAGEVLKQYQEQKKREQRAREAQEVDPESVYESLFGPREEFD
jgi:hypothetical protein